jgi:hypothetical protein
MQQASFFATGTSDWSFRLSNSYLFFNSFHTSALLLDTVAAPFPRRHFAADADCLIRRL